MATSRATLGSIFAAVQSTATTATNTLQVLDTTVNGMNGFVEDKMKRAAIRRKGTFATFKEQLHRELSQEEADSTLRIQEYMNKSDSHKSAYESAYNRIAAALNEA